MPFYLRAALIISRRRVCCASTLLYTINTSIVKDSKCKALGIFFAIRVVSSKLSDTATSGMVSKVSTQRFFEHDSYMFI